MKAVFTFLIFLIMATQAYGVCNFEWLDKRYGNDPQVIVWQLDHSRLCDEETSSFLDEKARVLRRHTYPNQWITTNFIPVYDARFKETDKEFDFVTYIHYMVYGEHEGIGKKGYRVGEYSRIALTNDYFRPFSPIYGVMEQQPGQVNLKGPRVGLYSTTTFMPGKQK